jgi:hypothetical protein
MPKGQDINPLFGIWHLPNSYYIQKQACLDVVYRYNSVGARDFERTAAGKNRFIVLGDSYIEGYGIDTTERITNILERKTDYAFLNFGTSGGFGSTQMMLNYQFFHKQFEHQAVLIGLFPTNDFSDDSIEFGKLHFSDRYRPYQVATGIPDSFRLIYYLDKIEDSSWSLQKFNKGENSKIRLWLYSFTHIGSVYKHLKDQAKIKNRINNKSRVKSEKSPSKAALPITFKVGRTAHYDFLEQEFDILMYNLKEIKKLAGDRPVYVFTIPARYELFALSNHDNYNKLGPRLKLELDSIDAKYIDIISPMIDSLEKTEFKNLYLTCDGHWSEYGHQFAADIIASEIVKNN